jgi:predicted transcriptional regulator
LLNANLVCGDPDSRQQIEDAFASDLMSDVLTLDHARPLLITGLTNLQTIRTAEMADIHVIVFACGKKVTDEMLLLAAENNMALIETSYSVFRTSGILYQHGIKPIF